MLFALVRGGLTNRFPSRVRSNRGLRLLGRGPLGTFREHSGNIQGTFREHSGTTFGEHSRRWLRLLGRKSRHLAARAGDDILVVYAGVYV